MVFTDLNKTSKICEELDYKDLTKTEMKDIIEFLLNRMVAQNER